MLFISLPMIDYPQKLSYHGELGLILVSTINNVRMHGLPCVLYLLRYRDFSSLFEFLPFPSRFLLTLLNLLDSFMYPLLCYSFVGWAWGSGPRWHARGIPIYSGLRAKLASFVCALLPRLGPVAQGLWAPELALGPAPDRF